MQTSHRLLIVGFFGLCAAASGSGGPKANNWNKVAPINRSAERAHWRESQSCGVACAYMLARLVGRDVDYKEAVDAIPIEDGGSTLLAVQTGLGTMGVSAAVLEVKPTDLDRMAMPVIAHLLPRREASNAVGHFLLLLQVDDHSVRYIEPNYATSVETVSRNHFLRAWSGYVVAPNPSKTRFEHSAEMALQSTLAISIAITVFSVCRSLLMRWKQSGVLLLLLGVSGSTCLSSGCVSLPAGSGGGLPVPRESPRVASLVAWNPEVNLGVLPPDGAAEARFRIENIGECEAWLHLGSPTCRCSEARLEKSTLKPGESTNVRMVMRSRPGQAGPANAQVYIEADHAAWAETLSVHGVEVGGNFPDYTYAIGGPAPAKTASVGGTLFLKSPQAIPNISIPLVGGLESLLTIRDLVIGAPIEMPDCVRRDCSFTVALHTKIRAITERRELVLPVVLNVDGVLSTHHVRLTVLPSQQFFAKPKK